MHSWMAEQLSVPLIGPAWLITLSLRAQTLSSEDDQRLFDATTGGICRAMNSVGLSMVNDERIPRSGSSRKGRDDHNATPAAHGAQGNGQEHANPGDSRPCASRSR